MLNVSRFVAYVGPPDLHDGQVVELAHNGDTLRVLVQGDGGRRMAVECLGVVDVQAVKPEGMTLYALVEMTAPPPLRRFVFANWDDDASTLEVLARQVRILNHAPEAPLRDS